MSNPLLKKLGFSDNDRLMIINADDIGTTQASLAAYTDLLDNGLVSSASTMVPCAWFPAVAAFCRDNASRRDAASRVDVGVHITLTSDQDGCRWAPLSTRDSASGLLDAEGYFYKDPVEFGKHGDPKAVETEMRVQIERALAAGIDVTHLDMHQFSVAERPEYIQSFVQVGLQFGIPPLLLRGQVRDLADMKQGYTGDGATGETAAYIDMLEAQGLPVLDNMYILPLRTPEDRFAQMRHLLAALNPGVSVLIFHPAQDTPELRAFSTDWPARAADYAAFKGNTMRQVFQDAGVHVIGWRVLRDLMHAASQ